MPKTAKNPANLNKATAKNPPFSTEWRVFNIMLLFYSETVTASAFTR